MPNQAPAALRGPLTLALTLLGSAGLLVLGRHQLLQRPPATPATAVADLERTRRWDPDPERRREASLLLLAHAGGDPAHQRQLLQGQGWGSGPLAPVVLKLDALAAAAQGRPERAQSLWRLLRQRFPTAPSSADALYALGRTDPAQRLDLLRRFPAHPAALAAALEQGPSPEQRRRGALHLARWGPRWPGAEERLRQTCRQPAATLGSTERAQLAAGLAQLGDGREALACLGPQPADPFSELELGRALLKGDAAQVSLGERRLLVLARRWPGRPEAQEAVRLLSQQEGKEHTLALLGQLPQPLVRTAPVQARLAMESGNGWRPVLLRWPQDPASWDLQWDLARQELLKGRWATAVDLLEALPPERLPTPLATRQLFWLGFGQWKLGQEPQARRSWERLLARSPWGYYAWRAWLRLGEGAVPMRLRASGGTGGDATTGTTTWQPLASGQPELDRLWRLGLPLEAWEQWRLQRRNRTPTAPGQLLVEGRLRLGVGDDWTGLGQLELASLRWSGASCAAGLPLERALHPVRHGRVFQAAAAAEGLDPTVLLAVAKQESRFSPGVGSAAGAVGLLQLMPATAAELAGRPVSSEELRRPERNAPLGARYLRQLLDRWQGNPFLAIASYNAGPGAVQAWLGPRLGPTPELWVEAIPYPETRLYVKKVLGNLWSYQELPRRGC